MSNGMIKNSEHKLSKSYAALKSNHEVYYQMASILKQVSENEEQLANGILTRLILSEMPEFSLENSI